MSLNNINKRRDSFNLNLLGSIIYDHYEKSINNDDVRTHIRNFLDSFFRDKSKDEIIQLKVSSEDIFGIVHHEIRNYFDTKNNISESNNSFEERYLSIKEVCDTLKITRQTLNNWKKIGLKQIKQGSRVYILKSDLDRFMNK